MNNAGRFVVNSTKIINILGESTDTALVLSVYVCALRIQNESRIYKTNVDFTYDTMFVIRKSFVAFTLDSESFGM